MTRRKLLIQMLAILCGSLVLGGSIHFSLIAKYLRGEFQPGFITQESYPNLIFITLPEAEDLFFRGETKFVDSRPEQEFLSGHILNAVNIPYDSRDKDDRIMRLDALPETDLVIYCDGSECRSSIELAKTLHDRGYLNIKVLFGGWEEWLQAGLPAGEGK